MWQTFLMWHWYYFLSQTKTVGICRQYLALSNHCQYDTWSPNVNMVNMVQTSAIGADMLLHFTTTQSHSDVQWEAGLSKSSGEIPIMLHSAKEQTPPISLGLVGRFLGSAIWLVLHLFDSSAMWPGRLPPTVCALVSLSARCVYDLALLNISSANQ